jgi:hypothetical protein
MAQPQSRITLGDLPPRARQLNASEMTTVFGGCIPHSNTCDAKNGTCCPGLQCRTYGNPTGLGAMGVWQLCT